MKNLTLDAVKDVTLDLISKNGKTSSLDVKNELRNQGYFATQSTVSDFMNDLYTSREVDYTVNGRYREYTYVSVAAPSVSSVQSNLGGLSLSSLSPSSPTSPSATHTKVKTPKVKSPKGQWRNLVALDDDDVVKGDWYVFDKDTPTSGNNYTGKASRNSVRYCFAQDCGFPYVDTRATRVK